MTAWGVLVLLGALAPGAFAQLGEDAARLTYHRVTSRDSPAPDPGAERQVIPSLVEGVKSPRDWYGKRRPEILALWTRILGKLEPDPARPGFERDHHEVLALAAPRPVLVIGGSGHCEDCGGHSDDRQSWGYINRAREVYRLLGVPDRLQFVLTEDGHKPNGPAIDPAWQAFFERWLKGGR